MVTRILLLAWTCTATQEDLHNILRPHSASKAQSSSHVRLEVESDGVNLKKSSFNLLRSERYGKRSLAGQEALLDSSREVNPEFGTSNATCDGTMMTCAGAGQDPCTQVTAEACIGLYHDCEGGAAHKRCEVKDGQCKSGSACYEMCAGYYFDKKSDGAPGNPSCSDLNIEHCQSGYVSLDGSITGQGMQCKLKDELTCVDMKGCAIQNPPEVLGEIQCVAPEVDDGDPVSTCEGSKKVRPNKECKTQCRWGFTPSPTTLLCGGEGKLTPETFTCIPNECPAPTVVKGHKNGVCAEGAKINSGSNCTIRCKQGYSPNVASVACYAQEFTPSNVYCQQDCTVPADANALGGSICKEAVGGKVKAYTACTLQCTDGYYPNTPQAQCNAGKLDPETLTCLPKRCPAPTGINYAAMVGACQEQDWIDSGGQCTTQCQPRYHPSKVKLDCFAGTLTPPTFECLPDPCTAPTVVDAPTPSCGNGAEPPHGSECIALCDQGFKPSIDKLTCDKGVLAGPNGEPTFRCVEQPCPTPKVTDAKQSACQEGDSIPAQGWCTAACKAGYQASEVRVQCVAGSLTKLFTCDPKPCPHPPNGGNARGCQEDGPIPSGGHCTAKCGDGTSTSPPNMKLDCVAGTLTPSTFTCGEDPCPAPTGISNVHTDGACAGGKTMIDSAENCVAKCRTGYEPDAPKLVCSKGKLEPASFTCQPLGCQVPTDGNKSCKGKKAGDVIAHGANCEATCEYNTQKPTQNFVKCEHGILPVFSCGLRGCELPSVQNGGCEESEIIHGDQCTAQCDTNYVPSSNKLACSGGELTPTTFKCEKYCVPPSHITCKQGSPVKSRETCTPDCKNGGDPDETELKCNDGTMPDVQCSIPPPSLVQTRTGKWSGDPHFRNSGTNSDPLRPGTQFGVKVECREPGAANWLISEVLQGPEKPSGSMGWAVTGKFMEWHVFRTVVTASGFGFDTTYDCQPITWVNNEWNTKVENGMQLSASISSKKSVTFNAGQWVSYTGTRTHWDRSDRVIDGHKYQDYYMSNSIEWGVCNGGKVKGVQVEGYGYREFGLWKARADRVPPDEANMFLKSCDTVKNYLMNLGSTHVRSRCFKLSGSSTYTELPDGTGADLGWDRGCPPCEDTSQCAEVGALLIQDDSKTITRTAADRRANADAEAQELALVNVTNAQRLDSLVTEAGGKQTFDCSAAAMAVAKVNCGPVEAGPVLDHDNRMNHDAIYVACIYDNCETHDPEVALQAQEDAAEEQKGNVLHHKFNFLACPSTDCPTGMKPTDQNDADLSNEEKLRLAAAVGDGDYKDKTICRSERAYIVTEPVFHDGTRWQSREIEGACKTNRLARPRTPEARTKAKEAVQAALKESPAAKAWLGGAVSGAPLKWKWYDWDANNNEADIDIDIAIGGDIDNEEGAHNFLCMEKSTGELTKCDIDAGGDADAVPMPALCETVFYGPDVNGQATDACNR